MGDIVLADAATLIGIWVRSVLQGIQRVAVQVVLLEERGREVGSKHIQEHHRDYFSMAKRLIQIPGV